MEEVLQYGSYTQSAWAHPLAHSTAQENVPDSSGPDRPQTLFPLPDQPKHAKQFEMS